MTSSSVSSLTRALADAFPHAVLICTADGAILHANAGAADLLGLVESESQTGREDDLAGRSIEELLDVRLAEREESAPSIQTRLTVGAAPSQLLRVDRRKIEEEGTELYFIQPVRAARQARNDDTLVLRQLTEGMRAPLASVRAAIETMMTYPHMEEAVAQEFKQIILDESVALSDHLEETLDEYAQAARRTWPLDVIAASDLMHALRRRAEAVIGGLSVDVDPPSAPVPVRVDSVSLLAGLVHVVQLLEHATRCKTLSVRVDPGDSYATLSLHWSGRSVSTSRLRKWEQQDIPVQEGVVRVTLRDVLEHHDAELWLDEDDAGRHHLRLLLRNA